MTNFGDMKPHEGAGRMTSFGDVNVGDKVSLTAEGDEIKGEVRGVNTFANWITVRAANILVTACERDGWDVEVLEPAPKPLPMEPGYYIEAADLVHHAEGVPLYRLSPNDHGWWHVNRGRKTERVSAETLTVPLIRLVPESAVEEARTETLASIIEWLNLNSYGYAGKRVQERFGGES